MMKRTSRTTAVLLAAALVASAVARADNQMGYRLETSQMAAALPRGGGSLGMKVGPEKEITSGGMTFEILKVEAVGQESPARQAGLAVGDQLIAVDGRVFPDSKTFAEYVGSVAPGHHIEVDYMPADGGPKQAQRVGVTVGEGGRATTPDKEPSRGLSTGAKVAIGVGAIAVIGCYEAGCFKRLKSGVDAEREKLRGEHAVEPTTLAMLAAGFAPAFVQASPSSAGMAKHKMMRSHAMKKHRMHAGHGGRMPASKNF